MEDTGTAGFAATIRARKDADLAALVNLLKVVHARDGYPVEGVSSQSMCETFLCPPNILYACVATMASPDVDLAAKGPEGYREMGDLIIGHALLTPSGPGHSAADAWKTLCAELGRPQEGANVVSLGRLFVSPDARGQGLGKSLVQECERWAASKGQRLVLDVMSKDVAAIAMYERLGWQNIGTSLYDNQKGDKFHSLLYVSPEI